MDGVNILLKPEKQAVNVLPSFDMFNLLNANTVMGRRTNQNAANANQVFGILAPRIARIGMMVTF